MTRKILFLLPARSHDTAHEVGPALPDCDYAYANIRKLRQQDTSADGDLTEAELQEAAEVFIERRYRRTPWMRRHDKTYRQHVYKGARKEYRRIVHILKHEQPTHVVFNNGLRLPESLVPIACRKLGIQPMYQEAGMIPKTLQLDPRGVNYMNCVPRHAAFYADYTAPEPAPYVDATGPIFIPFQVDYDTQIIAYSGWVQSMQNLLEISKKLALAVPDKQFVIKEHPMAKIKLETTDLPPNLRFNNSGNTTQMIAEAEAVITVNSTVGMEALLARKKTIALGQACYAIEGLTILAGDQDELECKVRSLGEQNPCPIFRDAFIRYLDKEFLVHKTTLDTHVAGFMRALDRDYAEASE